MAFVNLQARSPRRFAFRRVPEGGAGAAPPRGEPPGLAPGGPGVEDRGGTGRRAAASVRRTRGSAMRELTDQERAEVERDAVLPQLDARELVDEEYLERAIKEMYTEVAEHPDGEFHFLTGRPRAEGLGYDPGLLDRIPPEAVESFAGVGHYLDLAGLAEGECVVDLGSGSGTDLFCAAVLVGPAGRAIGIDMTAAQLAKAGRLRDAHGFSQVELVEARIEEVPSG